MVFICVCKLVTKLYLVEFMYAMNFATLDIASHVEFTQENLFSAHVE